MTDFDLWEGMDSVAPIQPNPFDPGTVEHATWDRQEAEARQQVAAARAAQRMTDEVQRQLFNLRARSAAGELFAAEQAQQHPVPDPTSLDVLLDEPDEETEWRFDQVWPRHGNVVLAAQYKAGKTTLVGNVLRCLVDGDRFLGLYRVDPVEDGTVALTDFEMPRNKIRQWLRDQGVQNATRVQVWSLRGQTGAFDLLDASTRATWVKRLREVNARVWVVDCLGPILSALGFSENENKEVGRFLDALTSTATEAGVDEVLLVHHMGHGAERSRGASRLRDWPDAEWRLVRQKDEENPFSEPDPAAPGFFTAFGRDVDVREGQLLFDPLSRRLLYAEGNRRQARAHTALTFVLDFVRGHPGATVRQIQSAAETTDNVPRAAGRDAIKTAVGRGLLSESPGPNRSQMHNLTAAGFAFLAGPPYDEGMGS